MHTLPAHMYTRVKSQLPCFRCIGSHNYVCGWLIEDREFLFLLNMIAERVSVRQLFSRYAYYVRTYVSAISHA